MPALDRTTAAAGFFAYGFLALAGAVLLYWGLNGAHRITQYQVMETYEEVDPDFGDTITRERLVDQFRFGLLPDRGYDGAAPLALFFGLTGGGLLWWYRRAWAHLQRAEHHPESEEA